MDYNYILEEFKAYHLIWKGYMHLADECKETRAQKDQRIAAENQMDDRYEKMKEYVISLIGEVMFDNMKDYKLTNTAMFFNLKHEETISKKSIQIYAVNKDDEDYVFWAYNFRGDGTDAEIEKKIVFTMNFFNLDGIILY